MEDESPKFDAVPTESEIDTRTNPEPELEDLAADSEDRSGDKLGLEYYKSVEKYLIEKHELNKKTGRQNRVIICK